LFVNELEEYLGELNTDQVDYLVEQLDAAALSDDDSQRPVVVQYQVAARTYVLNPTAAEFVPVLLAAQEPAVDEEPPPAQ